jgi:sortase A
MSVLALARRRRRRPLVRGLAWLLIVAGLALVGDVALTLAWQEPVSAVIATIERHEIDQHWLSYRTAPLVTAERRALAHLSRPVERIAYLARRERRELRTGDALGRLLIARLHTSFLVVQGTDQASLEKGPGHYPATALPGMGATVAIAGHRTTFLEPFRHLDQLGPGMRLVLAMPYGRFVYRVQFRRIVAPTALWITRNAGYDRLVLSACNPVYSAAQRIVVFARLVQVVPRAPASA